MFTYYNNKSKIIYHDDITLQIHRDEDLPAVIDWADGYQVWYQQGVLHRDNDQPAIISPAVTGWFSYGKPHRLTGPAIIYTEGLQEWCYQGIHLFEITCQEEFEQWLRLRLFQ